ncbi:MAG: LysR family transcriptional regulator [Bacteroidota bacterium]
MEIKYFRLIKTIADEGNIANSSQKLFLTQSALSHQLRDLEERLGFKVFLRARNRWELTEEGQELYRLANDILSRIESGFDKIKHILDGAKGNIRLSMECYSFYQGISGFLQKMGALYPEIIVDLILEATHHPIPKLLSNDIDIAIVTSKQEHENLTYVEISEDEIFAIIHQENELNQKDYLEAGDFLNQHLIIHSFPLETVTIYEKFLKPNQSIPIKISAMPMTEVSLELVGANQGLMCLPMWALRPFNLPNELSFKKIGVHGLKRTHYLVIRKSDLSKKYISDFVSNFREHFASEA